MTNPFTTSQRPRPGDHLVLVQFKNNPKPYQYLCRTPLKQGEHAYVYSPYSQRIEQVEVYHCFLPSSDTHGKRIIEHLFGPPARNHEEAQQILKEHSTSRGKSPEATVDTLGVCKQGDYVVSVTFSDGGKQYDYFASSRTMGAKLPKRLYVLTPRNIIEVVRPQEIRWASATDRFKRIIESNDGTHAKTRLGAFEIVTNHNERNEGKHTRARIKLQDIKTIQEDIIDPLPPDIYEAMAMYSNHLNFGCDNLLSSKPIKSGDTVTFNSTPNTTTVKEPSAMINITTVTYVNGRDVNDLSNDDIMGLIARANQRIEQLEKTDPRPGRLNNEVKSLRDGVAQLVKLLDDLDAEKDAEKDAN